VREQRLDAYAERFAGAGLAALVFDYRHFGASAGEPRQLLDITRQLRDWGAAIAFVRSRVEIDPGRVALWGTSFSGGHVMETAARDRQIAAVVAQVPFADGLRNLPSLGVALALRLVAAGLRDQIGAVLGRPPHMVPSVGPPGSVAVMTTPDAEPGFRAIDPPGSTWRNQAAARIALRVGSYRPGRHADRIAAPILFAIAEDDAVTPAVLAHAAAARAPHGEVRTYPGSHSTSTSEPRSNERSPTKRSSSPITCSVPHFAPARAVRMDLGPRAGKLDLIAEAPPRGTQRHPMAKRLRSCRRRDSRRGELRT
jgi:dienelactone hydrolase